MVVTLATRAWRVTGKLGDFWQRERNCGMRTWRVEFALSVTLVHERIGLPHV